MTRQQLKPRLSAAASFARKGKRFADIGTDHAYLPVYLCQNEISPGGVASDINRGPLERAKQNIYEAGLSERISVNLGDGLTGTENSGADDIYILGMGGELIVKIMAEKPYLKDKSLRLILQPMTHQKDVRVYLLGSGFNIIGEKLVKEDGRIYQVICAEYDGIVREWGELELLVGRLILEEKSGLLCEYLDNQANVYDRVADGIEKSGKSADYERQIAEKMRETARK